MLQRSFSVGAQTRKMHLTIPQTPQSTHSVKVSLPNGKEIDLPIREGEMGAPMIDVTTLFAKSGYLTIDPGYNSTGACLSTITYIDGEKGKLLYRGYPIEHLASKSTYMEVCYLMIYGSLPSKDELVLFESTMVSEMMINEKLIEFFQGFQSDSDPMAIMVGVIGALSAFMHGDFDVNDPRDREFISIKLVAKMPTLAAYAFRTSQGLPLVLPKKEYSFMKNFLYMMFSNPMEEFTCDPFLEKVMDIMFILYADHEQNASTSTVRIAGSSLANPFACISAGITALWGSSHGGANIAVIEMLEQIGKIENIVGYLENVKNKANNLRLMGFGHRVYKCIDPRAKVIKSMCKKVIEVTQKTSNHLDLALSLEQIALKDDYFVKRGLYPNVDYFSGIIYEALDFPLNMFTVLFAVQRSIGWITNWSEMMADAQNKISRPRQLYVGYDVRNYIKVDERPKVTNKLIKIKYQEEKSRIVKLPMISPLFNLVKI